VGTLEAVDIQIGRGKSARRAYGIDEIALCPGTRTLDPSLADTRWRIGGIEREIPIIASAMDGVVDVRMAVLLSQLGALGELEEIAFKLAMRTQCQYLSALPQWARQSL